MLVFSNKGHRSNMQGLIVHALYLLHGNVFAIKCIQMLGFFEFPASFRHNIYIIIGSL